MDSIAKVIGYFVLALVAIGFISAWKEKRDADEGGPARPAVGSVSDDGSGLIICNRSAEPNSVALGSMEGGSWVTRGWFQLDKQQCKTLARGVSGKTYYVYAEGVRGSVWPERGTHKLCVHPKEAFTITGVQECEPRGFKTAQFRQIQVGADTNSFTYSMTGGKLSKIESLDVGERVYVQGFLSDELVTIVRIEKSNGTVKVERAVDGTSKWVSVDEVLTREEAQMNDVGRAAVGATIVFCLFSPESCQK